MFVVDKMSPNKLLLNLKFRLIDLFFEASEGDDSSEVFY